MTDTTTILLPGRLPPPAWVIHGVVGLLFLSSGAAAVHMGTAYWIDWAKLVSTTGSIGDNVHKV